MIIQDRSMRKLDSKADSKDRYARKHEGVSYQFCGDIIKGDVRGVEHFRHKPYCNDF